MFLSEFKIKNIYYDVEKLIQELGLEKNVNLCIPEIVWLEMKHHLISHYNKTRDNMTNTLANYRKSFGDLVEISYDFKHKKEYSEIVEEITDTFVNDRKCTLKIIPYPRDKDTLQDIIIRAIQSKDPFKKVKSNKKTYTDAGLKDTLIVHTIINNTKNHYGIFITNDKDFDTAFYSIDNVKLFNNFTDVKGYLLELFNIVSEDRLDAILKDKDNYIRNRILTDCKFSENSYTYDYKMLDYQEVAEGEKIIFSWNVEMKKYKFTIVLNIATNELFEATYEEYSEEEV